MRLSPMLLCETHMDPTGYICVWICVLTDAFVVALLVHCSWRKIMQTVHLVLVLVTSVDNVI